MLIASFDMGTRNFAFCVEEVDAVGDAHKPRFELDGTPTAEYRGYLDTHVYPRGKLVEMKCIDLKGLTTESIYLTLSQVLDSYSKLWDAVDVFLIEQQMAYGHHKSNIQALRLAQHCLSYFYTIYGCFKKIQEFSSTHKTRVLGCPKFNRRTHKDRKQFSVALVSSILSGRKDPCLGYFEALSKKDDVSDCVLMIQAYKVLSR